MWCHVPLGLLKYSTGVQNRSRAHLEPLDRPQGAGSEVAGTDVRLQPHEDVGVASVQTDANLRGRQPATQVW